MLLEWNWTRDSLCSKVVLLRKIRQTLNVLVNFYTLIPNRRISKLSNEVLHISQSLKSVKPSYLYRGKKLSNLKTDNFAAPLRYKNMDYLIWKLYSIFVLGLELGVVKKHHSNINIQALLNQFYSGSTVCVQNNKVG